MYDNWKIINNNHITVDCSNTVESFNNLDNCNNYCEANCNKSNYTCYINTTNNTQYSVIKTDKDCKPKLKHNIDNSNYKSYEYVSQGLSQDSSKDSTYTCGCSTNLLDFDKLLNK
jgi:hypothetical protein